MKGILLLLFITLGLKANVCSQLEQEMIVMENTIQKSSLPQCSASNNQNCCRADEPDSCLKHNEVEARYNDAMAKLVIYEGLLALGEQIEDNHKIIKNIDQSKLDTAKTTIDDFFQSVNKAELINNSLELNGEDGLWTNYQGNQALEMENYINIVCAGEQYQSFCSSYQRILQEDPASKYDYLESIHGFAVADRHVLDNNKRRDYAQYQDYLTISINGEDISYDQINAHPEFNKLKNLKEKITSFGNNRSDSNAREILALTKELNDVDVNFNEGIDVKSRFKDFISDDVAEGIASLNQSTQLMLGSTDFRNNLEKMITSFGKQQNSHRNVLKREIRELIAADPALSCQSGEDETRCLVRICEPMALEEACNNRSNVGITELYKSKKRIDNLDETQDMLESTKVCLENQSLDEQEACVLSMKADLFDIAHDKVEELRRELAHVENIRSTMNHGEPFKDLKKEKALVLMAFKNLGCLNAKNIVKVDELQSSCQISEITDFSQTSLELKSDVDEIMINLAMQPHLDNNLSMENSKYIELRNDYLTKCNDEDRSGFLCDYFQAAVDRVNREQELINSGAYSFDNLHSLAYNQAGVGEVGEDTYENPEEYGLGEAAVLTAYTGAQLIPGFIQLGYMKQNHEYQMNSQVNYLNNLYRQRDYYNWYQNNYQNITLQNYGWNYYDTYNASTFNGGNTAGLYYSPTDYSQLNFASPMLMSPTTFDFSATPTTPATSTTTMGFSF
tara:strand:+ start:26251 stop:28455 length:2205 start_codon:yes stop_codon:yes gene_type:complete